jgi:hypothetical protein
VLVWRWGWGPPPPHARSDASAVNRNCPNRYGKLDSVRIDILENVGNGTVCVYDIKTGRSSLSLPRSAEIAGEVHSLYPGTQRIVVIETRTH